MTYEQYTKVFQVLTVDMDEDELRSNLFEVAGYPDDEEDTASIPPISAGEFATILVRIANSLTTITGKEVGYFCHEQIIPCT